MLSPPPSCPAARKRFGMPGIGPITGLPSGTENKRNQKDFVT